jgi:hypothetical protein
MYQERKQNGAVVHLHSTHSVAVSVLAEVDSTDVLPPLTAYYVMRIGRLPLVPYYAPGDPKLADAVRGFAGKHHAVLLANHGPVVAGSTLAAPPTRSRLGHGKLFILLRGEKVRLLTPERVAELRAVSGLEGGVAPSSPFLRFARVAELRATCAPICWQD